MANRLAYETSPYLLQHANNPVEWYPWGKEALDKAVLEDKPIFLSIGYSACHWCHVMENESFENVNIATQMNRDFVNIKVDREERPDLDSIYMVAVQTLTGRGGWPMSVFLTPEGKPFYGGTYYPPDDRGGLPSFPKVLSAMAEAYRNRKNEVLQSTSHIVAALESQVAVRRREDEPRLGQLEEAFTALSADFDDEHGGFGIQPKFPQPLTLEFLLRYWKATGANRALDMVTLTLTKMARGGMYDQLGGGFHRYSTDSYWLVPHFEKMLYDNALLTRVYLHAWQETNTTLYRSVIEDTLEYVLREMTHDNGGFYSAQDADSEGKEGKFFVWLSQDVDALLGKEDGRIFKAFYDVSDFGNWEGQNILNVPELFEDMSEKLGVSESDLLTVLARSRSKLLASRGERIRPGLDDKVLASWNGMMMASFAECGSVLGEERWVEAAIRNAEFVLTELRVRGRLQRTWRENRRGNGLAKLNAYLEDYASVAVGLITLYEATFEHRWIDEATTLVDEMIDLFWSVEDQVFYDTGVDHERLVVKPRDVFDNAAPCGGSLAATSLLRLAVLTGRSEYNQMGLKSIQSVCDFVERVPSGMANWLSAIDFLIGTKQEIVIVGPSDDPATSALLDIARRDYAPNRVLAGSEGLIEPAHSPIFEKRDLVNGKPTAYVCENYACELPVNTPEDLAVQLSSG